MYRKALLALLLVAGLFVGLIPTATPVSAASCGMHIYILSHNNLTLDVSLVGGGGNLDWGDGTGAYFGEGTGQKIYHGFAYNVGGTTTRTIKLTPDGGGNPCSLTITIDDNNVPTFCNLYGVEVGFNALTVGADVQVGNALSARLEWGDGSYVDLGNGSGQHQWHSYSYNSQGQDVYTITLNIPHAPACTRTFTIDGPSQQGWLSGGDAVNSYYPCPLGIGPGGITPGNYDPGSLSQEQRQYLYQAFGNSGEAPVGYGGRSCSNGQQSVPSCPAGVGAPGSFPPESLTQQQRNELYWAFGHSGEAPVGYGGESCYGGTMTLPSFNPQPTSVPPTAVPPTPVPTQSGGGGNPNPTPTNTPFSQPQPTNLPSCHPTSGCIQFTTGAEDDEDNRWWPDAVYRETAENKICTDPSDLDTVLEFNLDYGAWATYDLNSFRLYAVYLTAPINELFNGNQAEVRPNGGSERLRVCVPHQLNGNNFYIWSTEG